MDVSPAEHGARRLASLHGRDLTQLDAWEREQYLTDVEGVLAAVTEWERARHGVRIREGQIRAAKEGKRPWCPGIRAELREKIEAVAREGVSLCEARRRTGAGKGTIAKVWAEMRVREGISGAGA